MKTIIVTGASSGIGLTAALHLKQRGYQVLVTCRQDADLARLQQMGLTGCLLDLNDSQSVIQAAKQLLELSQHRIYALFNNAGFAIYGPLREISRQQLEQQFATNLFGVHQLTQLLLPAMRAHRQGRIIQTSSILGIVTTPKRGAYSASKFALEAWSNALRMELAAEGISVSLIEPGPINSRFSENVQHTSANDPVKNPPIAARFALSTEAVLPALYHALESKRPKARYTVTWVAKVLVILQRILPTRLLDVLLAKP